MAEAPPFVYDDAVRRRWERLTELLQTRFGHKLKVEGILLLVGIQETGGRVWEFSKDEKMDLMHVGTCAVLELGGFYRRTHVDADGWPHWELGAPLPALDMFAQAQFLQCWLVEYFSQVYEL